MVGPDRQASNSWTARFEIATNHRIPSLTLDVHNDELMLRHLECEVAEGVRRKAIHVRYETGIGIVLDVFTLYQMFHAVQRTILALFEFDDVSLEEIDLHR